MVHSRCAPALLRRSLRFVESASSRTLESGVRSLASWSAGAGERTGSERAGWGARAAVVGGGVAAVTGFLSLLQVQQPVVSRSEGVQQIEAPVATETIVARYVSREFVLIDGRCLFCSLNW